MIPRHQSYQARVADCIVIESKSRKTVKEIWMGEEGITAVENLFGFFVNFAANREYFGIYRGVAEASWGRERR